MTSSKRVLEADLDLRGNVTSFRGLEAEAARMTGARASRAPTRTGAAHAPEDGLRVGSSKKHLEEVGEAADSLRPRSFILDVEPLESGGEPGTALRLCDPLVLLPVRPELIVFAPLLGVRDDGVGLMSVLTSLQVNPPAPSPRHSRFR